MSKEEFLRILRLKLSGAMAPSEVESQVDYYSAYIAGELSKGKSESQIIEELGDPVLIAKTLTSAMKRAEEETEYRENINSDNEYQREQNEPKRKSKVIQIGSAGCIIGFIVALFIIILLIVLMVRFSVAIVRFLWPVIIVLVVGGIIYGLLRRK